MDATRAFTVEKLELTDEQPQLRPHVVEGIIRRGEVANWIAGPKTGKTWLLYSLLARIIGNREWCGHAVQPGRVLLIDNELHAETGKARLWRVFHQAGVPWDAVSHLMDVAWCRGRRGGLEELEATVRAGGRGRYALVAIDALYRFIPKGVDENANSDMTQVYNHLDAIAAAGDCGILCVHHATKGGQTGKEVMDIGAGAGAIGRAVDGHVTFVRHKVEGCVTMRAKARSFAQRSPSVLQVDFQTARVWERPDLKPDDVWIPDPPKRQKQATD